MPVWLASMSLWPNGRDIKLAERWRLAEVQQCEQSLLYNLRGVGDSNRERFFRMCSTACIQRALTDEERESIQLPDIRGRGIAGGPVVVYRSQGVSSSPSTLPCQNLTTEMMGPLKIPIDCGECTPCLSRAELIANLRR